MMHREDCERCLKSNNGISVMSMFNTQIICLSCQDKEKENEDYKKANQADINQIKSGNFNFEGIGLPNTLDYSKNKMCVKYQ